MKHLKKFSLVLVVLITIFGNLEVVDAATATVGSYTASHPTYQSGATSRTKTVHQKFYLRDVDATFHIGSTKYGAGAIPGSNEANVKYYWHKIDGKDAYCLDAKLPSDASVYAARFAYHEQYDNNGNGVLDRIKAGGKTQQRIYTQDVAFNYVLSMEGPGYFEKSLALRTLGVIFGTLEYTADRSLSNNAANNYPKYQYNAFYGTVKKWVNGDAEIKSYIDKIHDKVVELTGVAWSDPYLYNNGNVANYWSGSTVENAKAMFKGALAEAANYIESVVGEGETTAATVTVDYDGKPTAERVDPVTDAKGELVGQTKTHTIEAVGLKNVTDPIFRFTGLTVDNSSVIIEAIKITVDGTEKCNSAESCKSLIDGKTNLLDAPITGDKTTITITVKASGYRNVVEGSGVTKLNCDELPANYHITYDVKTTNSGGAGEGEASTYSGDNKLFIVWYNKNDATKATCSSTEPKTNSNCLPTTQMQRFLTYHGETNTPSDSGDPDPGSDDDVTNGQIDDSMQVIDNCEECEELKEKCVNGGEAECNQYMAADCDKCEVNPVLCVKDRVKYKSYCDEMETPEYKELCPEDETCEIMQSACISSNDKGSPVCTSFRTKYPDGCTDKNCEDLDKLCHDLHDDAACTEYEAADCEDCNTWYTECITTGDKTNESCQKFKDHDCPTNCDKLEQLCRVFGDGSEYCTKFESECSPTVDECKTEITMSPKCCEDPNDTESEMLIDEMYKFDGLVTDNPFEIHGIKEDDIKKCFVDKIDSGVTEIKDDAGNSYGLKANDGTTFEHNEYCKVNCREDYSFYLPTAKRVNAGRYFTFQAKLAQANKQCFTSRIDKDKFKEKLEEILKEMEKQYNKYQEYKYAYDHATANPDIEVATSCNSGSGSVCASVNKETIKDGGNPGSLSGTYSYTGREFRVDTTRGDLTSFNTKPMSATHILHTNLGGASTCSGGEICTPVACPDGRPGCEDCDPCPGLDYYPSAKANQKNLDDFKNEMKVQYEAAETAYNNAVSARNDLIDQFNKCASWETDYEIDPKLNYTYAEEDYRDKAGLPKEMQINGGSINMKDAEYDYCIQDWNKKSATAEVNDDYTARSGCNFGSSDDKENLKLVRCTLSTGTCEEETKEVSKAIYKKYDQGLDYEADPANLDRMVTYVPQKLFYNIYPYGEIRIASETLTSDTDENNPNINAARELEKDGWGLLPVSLSTPRGVKTYEITITNIGEYYDKDGDNQGRFAGGTPSVVTALGSVENSVLYTCAYLINIPNQAMKCDFTQCEGEPCKSQCLGNNCDDEDFECDDIKCVTNCVGFGCLYDDHTGSNLLQKTVTLNKLFPNGTDAYNWDADSNDKAALTIKEIEVDGTDGSGKDAGNGVYDTDPVLSLTISPKDATKIKEYNKSKIDGNKGSYSNKTIYCRDKDGHKLISCFSTFIDDVMNGQYGKVNDKSTALRTRNNASADTEYFKTWSGYSAFSPEAAERANLGPAWK